MSVGASTTGDLFSPPAYPGDKDAAGARRWLAWKVGIDLAGVAFYANPDTVLREAIVNYSENAIAGRSPAGKVETMRQLFERTVGSWAEAPSKKRPGTAWHGKRR